MSRCDGDAAGGGAMVEAFLAGEAEAMIEMLSPDATFHSPVTDYHGRERVAEVLRALVQVLADPRASVRFEARDTTAAFFTATGVRARALCSSSREPMEPSRISL